MWSRENYGVLDRRETEGKKMEKKPRLTYIKPWKKRNHVRKSQFAKVVASP